MNMLLHQYLNLLTFIFIYLSYFNLYVTRHFLDIHEQLQWNNKSIRTNLLPSPIYPIALLLSAFFLFCRCPVFQHCPGRLLSHTIGSGPPNQLSQLRYSSLNVALFFAILSFEDCINLYLKYYTKLSQNAALFYFNVPFKRNVVCKFALRL